MVDRKFQKSNFDRCSGRILNFDFWYQFENGSSQNSKFKIRPLSRSNFEFLFFGMNVKNDSSQNSKFEFRPLPRSNFGFLISVFFFNGRSQNSKFITEPLSRSNFGINFKVVDRRIQHLKFDRCRGRIFEFWYKLKKV